MLVAFGLMSNRLERTSTREGSGTGDFTKDVAPILSDHCRELPPGRRVAADVADHVRAGAPVGEEHQDAHGEAARCRRGSSRKNIASRVQTIRL